MKLKMISILFWAFILSEISSANTYSLILTTRHQKYISQKIDINERINWHIKSLNLNRIWQKTRGSGVTVAILDTGLNDPTGIFRSQIIEQKNFLNPKSLNIDDVYGHGTSVTGIITGFDKQNSNFNPIAPEANILIAKVSDNQGSTNSKTLSDAIIWAADRGAKIVSVSYSLVGLDPEIEKAAQYLYSKGGLVIHSTGNSGIEIKRKNSSFLLAVGASTPELKRAQFSNYGNFLDIVAPGVDIYTLNHFNKYTLESGTSFSTPLVAGIVALAMSCDPDMPISEIIKAIFQTTSEMNENKWNNEMGWGIVNPSLIFENQFLLNCKLKSDLSTLN